MKRIESNLKHPKEIYLLSLSRVFERAGYYSFRAVLILYLVGEAMNLPNAEAGRIYASFSVGLVLSNIIGGFVGDFLINKKLSIVIGGILQALGIFFLASNSINNLYFSLVLLLLGSGLYSPNILAQFGRLYPRKSQLLDGAYTIFYAASNIGAFLGPALLLFLFKESFRDIFIASGVFMLVSTIIAMLQSAPLSVAAEEPFKHTRRTEYYVLVAFFLIPLFWAIYNFSVSEIYIQTSSFASSPNLNIPSKIWPILNTLFILPLLFVASILWSYYFVGSRTKLAIGFLAGALSFGVIILIPDTPDYSDFLSLLFSFLLFSVAESLIAPLAHSSIIKFGNQKFLSLLMGLSYLPFLALTYLFGIFETEVQNPMIVGMISFFILCSVFLAVGFKSYSRDIKSN